MNILLIGYGKMGKTIEILAKRQGHSIVGKIDVDNQHSLAKLLKDSDVAIEFTTPHTAFQNISTCIKSNIPVVSGTTGWLDQWEEVEEIVEGEKGAFFYASNYSIGVNIFIELNRHLAHMMDKFPEYDVLLEEIHHTEKKDAPSGTAITLAEGVIDNLSRKDGYISNQISTNQKMSIMSKRIGKVYGIHEIQYHNEVDTLKIKHEAYGREGFANGAIKAAEWILGKQGTFGMNDMLGLGR